MIRLLTWIAIALLATYLVFIGGSWWGIYSSPLRILTMTMAAGVLVVWATVAWRRPEWRPRSVLLPAILASLGSLAISTLFSRVPRVSLEYLGYAIVLAALYLLLARLLAKPYFRGRIIVLATGLFLVVAVAFVVRVVGNWIWWWGIVGIAVPPLRPRFEGLTYGNPSAVLTMIALLAASLLAASWSPTRRGVAMACVVAFVVGLVALLSGSRSGWLALALTAVVVLLTWMSSARRRHQLVAFVRALAPRWARFIAAGGLVTTSALVALAAAFGPGILTRAMAGGEDLRITYAVTAIRMFVASPLVGTGPGTWVIQRSAMTAEAEPDYYIPHAHNIEVQALAELGLVGAAAGLVLVVSLAWLVRDGIRDQNPVRRRWGWAALSALVYFGTHQLLDSYANMPAFFLAIAIPVAYLDATAKPPLVSRGVPWRFPRGFAPAGLALTLVATMGLLWQESAAMQMARAIEYANAGNWAAAVTPARIAAATDPDIGSYRLLAGLVEARAGNHHTAASHFQWLAERNDLPEAWLNLAAEQIAIGKRDEALASVAAALRLGWQRTGVAMPAGDLALRIGDRELALEAFAAAIAAGPSILADPWWGEQADRQDLLSEAVQQALQRADFAPRWEIAMIAGDVERAWSLAEDDGTAALVIPAWAGDPTNASTLFGACARRPLDSGLLVWCARVANRISDAEQTRRYREWATLLSVGWGGWIGGGELRVARVEYNKITGGIADLWATFTYRRPGPWDILVPSLVHLTVE